MVTTRFDIEKFSGKTNFGLWRIMMKALLVHQGLANALKDDSSSDEEESSSAAAERAKFHTEPLNELLESDDSFGFIVMDGNGTLFGTLSGNTREVLHKFTVDLPKKHGRGGQSALRFACLRMEKRHNYRLLAANDACGAPPPLLVSSLRASVFSQAPSRLLFSSLQARVFLSRTSTFSSSRLLACEPSSPHRKIATPCVHCRGRRHLFSSLRSLTEAIVPLFVIVESSQDAWSASCLLHVSFRQI
ncbi:hypothetical protein ACS0TY_016643 [Phlomoides rotata]